jgi:hypothetical protein
VSAKDWNIKGIADRVIEEMKSDNAGMDEIDDYVHRIAYLTVYSRVPEDAVVVAGKVKKMALEKYEEA